MLVRDTITLLVSAKGRNTTQTDLAYIPTNVDFGLRSKVYGPALYTQLKKILADYEAGKGL